jgi:hypothetical protein
MLREHEVVDIEDVLKGCEKHFYFILNRQNFN